MLLSTTRSQFHRKRLFYKWFILFEYVVQQYVVERVKTKKRPQFCCWHVNSAAWWYCCIFFFAGWWRRWRLTRGRGPSAGPQRSYMTPSPTEKGDAFLRCCVISLGSWLCIALQLSRLVYVPVGAWSHIGRIKARVEWPIWLTFFALRLIGLRYL